MDITPLCKPCQPNPWTLRRLIGKYTQICKLAAQCHSIPTAKNLREQAVLECLIELENFRREAAVSNLSHS